MIPTSDGSKKHRMTDSWSIRRAYPNLRASGRSTFGGPVARGVGVIAFLVVMLGLPVHFSALAQGETTGWSKPIALSSSSPSSWFPSIAADESGNVHVVWASTIPGKPLAPGTQPSPDNPRGYDVVMYSTSSDGEDWTDPNDVMAFPQGTGSEATRPSVMTDTSGTLHMSFRDFDVFYSHVRADRATDASAWLSPVKISTNGAGYYSQMARDAQGVLYMVYTQSVPSPNCTSCFHLLMRRSDDNGLNWSSLGDISLLPQGAAKPQLLIDRAGGLHVVWESGKGGGLGRLENPTAVLHSASVDGGKSWSLPYEFPAPSGRARNIAIGMDGQGRLLVTWLGLPSATFYYSVSEDNGTSWSVPTSLPEPGGYETVLDDGTMATDSAGNIHFVTVGLTGGRQSQYALFHLVWDAKTDDWQPPELITSYNSNVPEWPRVVVSKGNVLNLVWFVRDAQHIFDTDHAQYQIWYSQFLADAPAIRPISLPPQPSPSVLVPATPTLEVISPTSSPDLSSTNPTLTLEPVKNENGILVVLGKSLVLPLILLLLVLSYIAIRR